MSCRKCGSPFHEEWACWKSTAARKDVQSGGSKRDSDAAHDGIRAPVNSGFGSHTSQGNPIAGTQAPPVDTLIVGKRRGRPQTITDMKAYRAQKARERRAKKASIPS